MAVNSYTPLYELVYVTEEETYAGRRSDHCDGAAVTTYTTFADPIYPIYIIYMRVSVFVFLDKGKALLML